MSRTAASLVALAALGCAGPLGAHHSISTVDITTPVWVKGTVVRYEIANPHTIARIPIRKSIVFPPVARPPKNLPPYYA